MTRAIALFAAAAVLIGIGVGAFLVMYNAGPDGFAACRRSAIVGGSAAIGGPFALTDGAGARVTEAEAITGPTLIYFGYTFCPDFCPTDLARNAAAADLLAERGIDVGLVFITIDPERDTPEVASEYAASLHPAMIGLSGSPEDVAAAAEAYRVYWRKAGDDPTSYLMDHSTFTYLASPGQPFLEFFSTSAAPEEVADAVACYADAL
ncbi:MAG: SCO family protein [Rhodobacteraceae bacterium]|nr:SCO family protein [Paracoccaceae bacterium]